MTLTSAPTEEPKSPTATGERFGACSTCRGTWARVTIDHFRRAALLSCMGHRVSTNVISVHRPTRRRCAAAGRAGAPRARRRRPRSSPNARWPRSQLRSQPCLTASSVGAQPPLGPVSGRKAERGSVAVRPPPARTSPGVVARGELRKLAGGGALRATGDWTLRGLAGLLAATRSARVRALQNRTPPVRTPVPPRCGGIQELPGFKRTA